MPLPPRSPPPSSPPASSPAASSPLVCAALLLGTTAGATPPPSTGAAASAPPSAAATSTPPAAATPIVPTGAAVLRARAAEVDAAELATPAFQALVARMVTAMREAPGVGLAAPQLGVGKRVFVVEDTEERMAKLTAAERAERARVPVPLRVFVNPVVTPVGEARAVFFEGCLSVAGFSALVPRYDEVEVRGLNEHGAPVVWRVRGWPARIVQHELDHLDGVLYVDRMLTRSFGTTPQNVERFGGRPIAEIRATLGL